MAMNRPMRRGHTPPSAPPPGHQPPFGYVMEAGGGKDGGHLPPPGLHPQDYDDPYHPQANLYDFQQPHLPPPHQQPAGFMEHPDLMHPHHQYPMGYRDPHLRNLPPPAYRSREQPYLNMPPTGPTTTPYKILCITNINNKVSDNPVKEALINDFSRFGDISVSICHDSGERLAYIYFRSYEEAREARHAKTRTLLFDKPIEIEPIYDARASSPVDPNFNLPQQQQQQQQYPLTRARRSMTPPDYYDGGPLPPHARRPPHPLPPPTIPPPIQAPYSHHHHPRDLHSPNYHPGRPYPLLDPHSDSPGPSFDRHYPKAPQLMLPLPQEQPPYEQYKPYPLEPDPYGYPMENSYRHNPAYGPPPPQPPYPHNLQQRDRERLLNESQLARNLRHEHYHRMEQRNLDYPSPPGSNKEHQRYPPEMNPTHNYPTSRRSPPSNHSSSRLMSRDFRREKYGPDGYNNNNLDSEEGRPSRILFVTNIDQSKSEDEIRETFNPFGTIEEMDIRKILNSDILSCLIKFSSMDCAYRAKTALNGKYLAGSKKPCRVAYGKLSTSRRLWIGGLGSLTTVSALQNEFKKFGNIINLDYISGRPYAYVEYENANQAQFATHHLKGTIIADAERKIRIEYVDSVVDRANDNSRTSKSDINSSQDTITRSQSNNESWASGGDSNEMSANHGSQSNSNILKRSISPSSNDTSLLKLKRIQDKKYSGDFMGSTKSPDSVLNRSNVHNEKKELNNNLKSSTTTTSSTSIQKANKNGQISDLDTTTTTTTSTSIATTTTTNTTSSSSSSSAKTINSRPETSSSEPSLSLLNKCNNIARIVDCCAVSWFSQLVLRNFSFPCKMSLCSGDRSIIEKYIIKLDGLNGDSCPILKITQRWRLNPQPKLEEVRRKMQTANLGIIIITHATLNQSSSPMSSASPASCMKTPQTPNPNNSISGGKQNGDEKDSELDRSNNSNNTDSPTTSQSRPLKNLISYLEQKDAAGVISLSALNQTEIGGGDSSKLLYAFPPGDFAMNLLKLKAQNLSPEATKEEFLLGVIV